MAGHFENRLKGQKSPYLVQHSTNPVDWYPWGEEALARARRDDRPMLISIGYSSCHWCHVMERESFEDEETALVMNENFVNIKVDREERPDLDSLYMKAVQAMGAQAGWPLTVFATPEGVPFYGGSYFPPEDRFGMPSFKKVLVAVSRAYRTDREKVDEVTSKIEVILRSGAVEAHVELDAGAADGAFEASKEYFDGVNGGFGRSPKFPHAMLLKFLLAYHRRTGSAEALSMVRRSLAAMASGGIYDHLGGGFHRYAVDERWDVPHFEKMLYDNALLAGVYAEAFEATGKGLYRDVAIETLGYMTREMRGPEGGFYAAQDADVGAHEGAFYLWSADEIKSALGDDAPAFIDFFQVGEGENTLRTGRPWGEAEEPVPDEIKRMKGALFGVRSKRRPPDTDRKMIAAWNALAASSFAVAAKAFGMAKFMDEAKNCARFILSALRAPDGRLTRFFLDGRAGTKGVLEDYGLTGRALLDIYEATGEKEWLEKARETGEAMVGLFHDAETGLFFDTGRDQERGFVRERDLFDNDVPSGNSAAADLLMGLSAATGQERYSELAAGILRSVEGMTEVPAAYGNFLAVLEKLLSGGGKAR